MAIQKVISPRLHSNIRPNSRSGSATLSITRVIGGDEPVWNRRQRSRCSILLTSQNTRMLRAPTRPPELSARRAARLRVAVYRTLRAARCRAGPMADRPSPCRGHPRPCGERPHGLSSAHGSYLIFERSLLCCEVKFRVRPVVQPMRS